MFEHIGTGRTYTEAVKRIITGSVGFDDFEWGVSLFCGDALQFKKQSMRQDLMRLVLFMAFSNPFTLGIY